MIRKLLNAIYDSNAPLPVDAESQAAAMEDVEYFGIAPQVYYLLKQRGLLEQLAEPHQRRLHAGYDRTMQLNVFIRYETARILRAFDEAGIAVIPLKGVHLAMRYYGHIGARGTTDIDVLVRPEQVEQAADTLKWLGYGAEPGGIRGHFHHRYTKKLPGSPYPLLVELHWDLFMEGTARFDQEELWREADPMPGYTRVLELSDYHSFYMICMHGWKHGLDSMRYLIDIVQLLEAAGDRIDYDRLLHDASAHGTYKRMVSTLSVAYRLFPYLEERHPLPTVERRGQWWSYDEIRGTAPRNWLRYLRFLQYQWFDYDKPSHGLAAAIHYGRTLRSHKRRREEVSTNG